MNRIIAGLIITLLPCAALAQDIPAATDQVPIEEYVPKVIIEGKWGTGPGEFGRQGDFDYDLKPESLAVDSTGNVYILDYVNNRIQKYSSNGKHLKDIPIDGLRGPVQCWAVRRYDESEKRHIWSVGSTAEKPAGVPDSNLQAYIWPPEVQGINIVIDSKDNLYYYLKRTKDGKESGEVWQFRDDKLVKKTKVPSVTGGLSYYDGDLWITEYPYELVITDIGSDFNVFEGKKYPRKEVNQLKKQKMAASIQGSEQNRARYVSRPGSKEEVILEPVPGEEFVSPGAIRDSKAVVVSLRGEEKILNEYDLSGKLLRRLRAESRPRNGLRDSQDNFYIISTDNSGVKVTKYSREVVR